MHTKPKRPRRPRTPADDAAALPPVNRRFKNKPRTPKRGVLYRQCEELGAPDADGLGELINGDEIT